MSPRSLLTRTAAPAVVVLLAIVVTASVGGRQYTVKPGDTLSAIAARYHTTVAALVRLNSLPGSGDLIYAGSTLRLPGHGARGHHHRHGHLTTITYTVRPGDSLYAIATRFHASPTAIARRNHLPRSLIVVIGQHLRIRHHVRGAAHAHAHHSAAVPAGFRGFSVPSRSAVEAMIRSTAARWHVDSRFAL